jgi:hypothetical protein
VVQQAPPVKLEQDAPVAANDPAVAEAGLSLNQDALWSALDKLQQEIDGSTDLTAGIAAGVTIGVAATACYVLLSSRAVLWIIMALLSRPLWRQWDPLEVLFAWEKEQEKRRAAGTDSEAEESLQSIVDPT